jgi:hypothetical protein
MHNFCWLASKNKAFVHMHARTDRPSNQRELTVETCKLATLHLQDMHVWANLHLQDMLIIQLGWLPPSEAMTTRTAHCRAPAAPSTAILGGWALILLSMFRLAHIPKLKWVIASWLLEGIQATRFVRILMHVCGQIGYCSADFFQNKINGPPA